MNAEGGARESGGCGSDVDVASPNRRTKMKQRARTRRKRARVSVSSDETKCRLPHAHLAHLCHRHRVYRGLFMGDPRVMAPHRPSATDAVASCKLKRRKRTTPPFSGSPAAACDATATDRSAHSAENPIEIDLRTAPSNFLGDPRVTRAARAQ